MGGVPETVRIGRAETAPVVNPAFYRVYVLHICASVKIPIDRAGFGQIISLPWGRGGGTPPRVFTAQTGSFRVFPVVKDVKRF